MKKKQNVRLRKVSLWFIKSSSRIEVSGQIHLTSDASSFRCQSWSIKPPLLTFVRCSITRLTRSALDWAMSCVLFVLESSDSPPALVEMPPFRLLASVNTLVNVLRIGGCPRGAFFPSASDVFNVNLAIERRVLLRGYIHCNCYVTPLENVFN